MKWQPTSRVVPAATEDQDVHVMISMDGDDVEFGTYTLHPDGEAVWQRWDAYDMELVECDRPPMYWRFWPKPPLKEER